jgi:hypothetical protein
MDSEKCSPKEGHWGPREELLGRPERGSMGAKEGALKGTPGEPRKGPQMDPRGARKGEKRKEDEIK